MQQFNNTNFTTYQFHGVLWRVRKTAESDS